MMCENCDEEIKECHQCGMKFKLGDEVLCEWYSGNHFCKPNCMINFIDGDCAYSEAIKGD